MDYIYNISTKFGADSSSSFPFRVQTHKVYQKHYYYCYYYYTLFTCCWWAT